MHCTRYVIEIMHYSGHFNCLQILHIFYAWTSYSSNPTSALQQKSYLCMTRKGIARPQSNFHIHVSVCDLNSPTIGPHIFLQQNRQTDCGNRSHIWMWKLGLRPRKFFSGNTVFVSNFGIVCSQCVLPFYSYQVYLSDPSPYVSYLCHLSSRSPLLLFLSNFSPSWGLTVILFYFQVPSSTLFRLLFPRFQCDVECWYWTQNCRRLCVDSHICLPLQAIQQKFVVILYILFLL